MNGCKYCKPGNVEALFEEIDFDGLSVFIDNKPDGSILALGCITTRHEDKVETCVCNYHTIHYCPFCGRELDN